MRKTLVICIITAVLAAVSTGCRQDLETPNDAAPSPTPIVSPTPAPTPKPTPTPTPLISGEERKRMDLYIVAMRDAFGRMNGGDGFIAIRMDTQEAG